MRDPRWMLILLTLTQHQRLHWTHVGTEQLQLSQVNLDVKHITMLDDKLGQHFNLSGKHIPHCQHGQKTTSVQYVYATVCLGMHNSTSKWASRKTKKIRCQFQLYKKACILPVQSHRLQAVRHLLYYYTTKICIAPSRQANQKHCGRVIASLRVICSGKQYSAKSPSESEALWAGNS